METSESIGQLALALSKAQGMIRGAIKDSSNPFFKSKYADLSSVWDACREPLSKNELSVIQIPSDIGVETVLAHSSGEWIRGFLKICPVKNDAQSIGSALTYARRYALAAMVGIAPEDDDGNMATGKTNGKAVETTSRHNATPTANNNITTNISNATGNAIAYMESKGYSLKQMEGWIGYPSGMWKDKDLAVLKQNLKAGIKPEPPQAPSQTDQPLTQANGPTQAENGTTGQGEGQNAANVELAARRYAEIMGLLQKAPSEVPERLEESKNILSPEQYREISLALDQALAEA